MTQGSRGDGRPPRGGRGFRARPRRAPEEPASVPAARNRAVGLLSRRDYPSRALKGRLTQAGFEPTAAAEAVAELEDERLVNDERFVEAAIASRAARGQGPIRIAQELKQSGVAASLVASALDARDPRWAQAAVDLRRRRFGAGAPADAAARNKQVRFLLYRGFTGDQVRAALKAAGDDLEEDLDPDPAESALPLDPEGDEAG